MACQRTAPPDRFPALVLPLILLPLIASLGYALASLGLKRCLYYGIGPWRTTFIVNLMAGILFLPMFAFGGHWAGCEKIHQPLLAGLSFFVGQIFTFRAIARGDVSIVTPVLGLKAMLIAVICAVFLRENIPPGWWLASVLSVVAVALFADRTPTRIKAVQATVLLAFTSAVAFSVTDVLVQHWAPIWGAGYFIPMTFGTVALLSFSLVPIFHEPLRQIPRDGWRWLLGGSLMLCAQALVMACAIGIYGHATVVNIVYSCRGVWTIALVWIVGHWFGNEERHVGRAILIRRLIGAALLVAAIALL
jgi:drug/metabolite transporter (DMT)-like permease